MKEIKRMHKTGRPVLVGTTSVEQSELLASQLQKDGATLLLCLGTFHLQLIKPCYISCALEAET